ncbi:MAG: copper homeostasis protein CutC [Reichenbachiella sp.]|uniref:copper homeostasis protein CutC n=1 Tax=Reichenbachiella sp. TaxID=2184521 RepID=UPI0032647B85
MMRKTIKEACVESLSQAIRAQSIGADQIELCDRLDLDGTTPSYDLVESVLAALTIPVKVMVRPRGGDYIYSTGEMDLIMDTIHQLKELGVEEIVFGALTEEKTLDLKCIEQVCLAALPMKVTIHKAIDELENPVVGIRLLKNIPGVSGVLTSGGASTAKEGAAMIRDMMGEVAGQLQVIAAGKITNLNCTKLDELLGADAYHGKLIVGALN